MIRIGLDIGGTKTRGVALDPSGTILADVIRPTSPGPEGVIASAFAVTHDCLGVTGLTVAQLYSVGVGIPGRVEPESGIVRTAVNLGITELDLGPRLTAHLGVDVRIDNDVKAAALGAADHLDQRNLTLLNFGTGVASATLVNGHLVRGSGNVAGELGHMPIDPAGPACACGQRGCVESLAGGRNVADRLSQAVPPLALQTLVADAETDAAARSERDRIVGAIAAAVQMSVLAYGSDQVALSGGVLHNGPGLDDAVRDALAQRAEDSPFLASLDLPGRVVLIPRDAPVAVVGAALVGGSPSLASLAPR